MSKCPDARKCETLFIPTLLKLTPIVNFTLSFIAQKRQNNRIECMHGDDECHGNRQQLCVQYLYSQSTFLRYLYCQSKEIHLIPLNGERCAREIFDQSIKWSEIDRCVKSDKSTTLFFDALERTRKASARKSCTIHLNGKFWCMHDGYWNGCSEGRDERSLIKAICSRYNGLNKPAECSTVI